VESITGSVFVFVSRQAAILAQNALETVWRLRPDPLGELSASPDSVAEFRGEERWLRKTAGQRQGERVRKGEKGGCEGREGWGREGRKQRKVGLCPTQN